MGRQKKNYGKVKDSRTANNQQNKPLPTNKGKHQNLSKTDHGEKVKQAQALTLSATNPDRGQGGQMDKLQLWRDV